jgi:hypothetical protein
LTTFNHPRAGLLTYRVVKRADTDHTTTSPTLAVTVR